MTFTRQQKQQAYKKLSPEVQEFVMSNEVTELIGKYLTESGLNSEQNEVADSEILYTMFELQTLPEAISNIAKLSGKNINDLSKLKNSLEENIFTPIQIQKSAKQTLAEEPLEKKEVKIVKLDKILENRVLEIAKKYSLNASQTENLVSSATKVITNQSQKNTLLETLIVELQISKLLAEQLIKDLETRVFEYGMNFIQNRGEKTEPVLSKPSSIPEVRPTITPVVEKNHPQSSPVTSVPKYTPVNSAPSINSMSSPTVTTKQEFVQRPVAVPRFKAVPLDENGNVVQEQHQKPPEVKPSIATKPTPNFMDNKLSSVVKSVKEEPTPAKKYEVDPYREPLS
jgi:hypothetical protein